jgi:hypothetical protein
MPRRHGDKVAMKMVLSDKTWQLSAHHAIDY